MLNKHETTMSGIAFTLIVCIAVFIENTCGEPVFMAGSGREILVRKRLSGQVVKKFKVKEFSLGGVCVTGFYEEDILFYSADKKIHKIVLLDENGNRKVSHNGQLFTDPLADHRETYFYEIGSSIAGIVVDKIRKKLIFSDYGDIFEINFDGTGFRKLVEGTWVCSFQIYGNELLFSDQLVWDYNSGSGIYRVTIGNETISCKTKGNCQIIVPEGKDKIRSMMIERNFRKLFFRRGSNIIGVVDLNLPDSSYPIKSPRIVISDSQYVSGSGGIAVDGNRLVWNRYGPSYGQLLLGFMNPQLNFVSKKNIYVYGKERWEYKPRQLHVFQHKFSTQAPIQAITKQQIQTTTQPSTQTTIQPQTQAKTKPQIQATTQTTTLPQTRAITQTTTRLQTQATTQTTTLPQTQAKTRLQTQATTQPLTEPQTVAATQPTTQTPTQPLSQPPTKLQTHTTRRPQTRLATLTPSQPPSQPTTSKGQCKCPCVCPKYNSGNNVLADYKILVSMVLCYIVSSGF